MKDGLIVLKHPAADGLGREVKFTSGENLTIVTEILKAKETEHTSPNTKHSHCQRLMVSD